MLICPEESQSQEEAEDLPGISLLTRFRKQSICIACLLISSRRVDGLDQWARTLPPCRALQLPARCSTITRYIREQLDLLGTDLVARPVASGDDVRNIAVLDLFVTSRTGRYSTRLFRDGADAGRQTVDEVEITFSDPDWFRRYGHIIEDWSPVQRKETPPYDWEINRDWLNFLSMFGLVAFEKIFSGLGRSAYDRAVGFCENRLDRLRVRFSLDKDCYGLPLELMCVADPSDTSKMNFLCTQAPTARLLGGAGAANASRARQELGRRPRILVIVSDVGKAHKVNGPRDHIAHADLGKPFANLTNIGAEARYFSQLDAEGVAEVKILSIEDGRPLIEMVEETLTGPAAPDGSRLCWDIVHFAGHSRPVRDGRVFFILGRDRLRADAVQVDDFVKWIGGAGTHLVYLSSCSNSSSTTSASMARHGIANIVGFRWDLDDAHAADFARAFYDLHLRAGRCIGEAFAGACLELKGREEDHPIWAAPVLIAHGESWWNVP